ncbi:hypothetical protein [Herbaspirillum huttiense]|uniref:hypothetical protein n=1 Tax=Herbaspirillum huttiense TaxID=863372 RepID=UPI0039AF958F
MHLELSYPSPHATLPGVADHLRQLLPLLEWLAVQGLALESWYAPAAEAGSPEYLACPPAFTGQAPTSAAIAVLHDEDALRDDDRFRPLALWSGEEDSAGAFLLHSLGTQRYAEPCHLLLQSQFIPQLEQRDTLISLVSAMVQWWPASRLEIGVSSPQGEDALLDDPLDAVWMRYLPQVIDASEVVAGNGLRALHAADGSRLGTLILAVDADRFDPANDAHGQAARELAART